MSNASTNWAMVRCSGSLVNAIFLNVFGFLRWFPYDFYWASHTETPQVHPVSPQDQEVILPQTFTRLEFLKVGSLTRPVCWRDKVQRALSRGRLE